MESFPESVLSACTLWFALSVLVTGLIGVVCHQPFSSDVLVIEAAMPTAAEVRLDFIETEQAISYPERQDMTAHEDQDRYE